MSKELDLRIGVIGAGGRGGLSHYAHDPDKKVKLVAAADIDIDVLDEFSKKYGPEVFVTTNYRELLAQKDISVVMVCSPDYLHAEHAIAALKTGKNIYLEKPMAITTSDCDSILQAAYDNQCKLYVGHNMRHMSLILKMKELIDSGAIGEIKAGWCRHFISYGGDAYFRDWHAEKKYSNSLLLQKASHDIDILHWLCGGYSTCVNAMGGLTLYDRTTDRRKSEELPNVMENWNKSAWPPLSLKKLNPVIEVEDLSMMQMKLDNGVFACYQQCHFTPDAWRNYTFIGTEGRIENFGNEPGHCVIRIWNRRVGYNPYGDEQYFLPPEDGTHGGADPKIVSEFVSYMKGEGKIQTSAVAARNSVAACCAATKSLRNGGQIEHVPLVASKFVE